MFGWHRKEKPLQGMGGLGGGVVSRLMGGGALAPISATGGDSTLDITGYKVHIFTMWVLQHFKLILGLVM